MQERERERKQERSKKNEIEEISTPVTKEDGLIY